MADKLELENKKLKRQNHKLETELMLAVCDRNTWQKLYEARDIAYNEASRIIELLLKELDG